MFKSHVDPQNTKIIIKKLGDKILKSTLKEVNFFIDI
jgi:hypothetical protein